MATTVLRRSSCSKNWKTYKIQTKDIGIQAYHVVIQLGVGYRAMALAARRWRWQGGSVTMASERGGHGGGGREEAGGAAAAQWLIHVAVVAAKGNHPLAKLQNTLPKTIISDSKLLTPILSY
jgi:hypothetical protein